MKHPTSQQVFSANYFIQKLQPIADDMWTVGTLKKGDKMCVLGWCGAKLEGNCIELKKFTEAAALYKLFQDYLCEVVFHVNDKMTPRYPQPHSKQRILAALYDIKKMQEGQEGKTIEPTHDPIIERPFPADKIKKEYVVVKISESILDGEVVVKNIKEQVLN